MKEKKRQILPIAGEVLLTVYLYLISYFYTLSPPLSLTAPLRLLVFYGMVHLGCGQLKKIRFALADEAGRKNLKFGVLVFAATAAVLIVYWIAWYPGGLIVDTFNQWYQVQQGFLLDWHPAIHTLLFLKLPSLICNSLAFINLVQIVWLGLASAYLGMVLERWGIKKRYILAAQLLGFGHPAASIVHSFCWKDTALTIFVIVLAGQVLEIVFSDGAWLKRWDHLLAYGLCGALAALMRHNAILLVGPLMLLTAFFYWKEIRYYCFLPGMCTLLFMAAIKGPVYRLLDVQSHPQVSAEMLGVPMTILANVLIHNPEALDPEAREFLYRIGDRELWEENYVEGNWNSAKWMGDDISNDVIEEVGAGKVLLYTWHALQREPRYAYRAAVKLFEVVWKPAGTHVTWSYSINVDSGNIYGYETRGVFWMQKLLNRFRQASVKGTPLTTWGWHIGFFILLLSFAGVSRLGDCKKLCLCWLPILCYDFGTALLLCGPDFRFFSFNTVVVFPLLLALLSERDGKNQQKKL